MYSIRHHPPANSALYESMLMMVLGRQGLSAVASYFAPATLTLVYSRMRYGLTWVVYCVKGFVFRFFEISKMLVVGHYFFSHRALAAFAAAWERFLGERAAARATPPLS